MSKRVKAWARGARVALLEELGAYCHWPGCRVQRMSKLTFDHVEGKAWEATGLSTDQRMVIYRREAKEGLLQVLCARHNELKGDPQGNPGWKGQWLMDLEKVNRRLARGSDGQAAVRRAA